jgi:hypothetical protein
MGLTYPALAVLLGVSSLKAQTLSFGVKAGLPLTDSVISGSGEPPNLSFDSTSKKYIVGVMGELGIVKRFSVEADFLYHPLNLREASVTYTTTANVTVTQYNFNVFEFPIMAKYRFSRKMLTPFAEGGIIFRAPATLANEMFHLSAIGISVGGGMEFRARRLKISPEIRYTHWPSSSEDSYFWERRSQAALLVGIAF